jgi:hypothetical protein
MLEFLHGSEKYFFNFEIRGVLNLKTCLDGGNLVNLTIHAP